MNPPPALHSAMSRDRKPFTYTPGGLDLSEIKSQRMAQRLMRNAMNPGVPEVPTHPVLPSGVPTVTSGVPVALPNYNCMPVQVFPAMPANPKSLLRSRSHPEPRETPVQRVIPSFVNNAKLDNNDALYNNMATMPQQITNSRHMSLKDYSGPIGSAYNTPRLSYGSDGYSAPATAMPSLGHLPLPAFAPVAPPVLGTMPSPLPARLNTSVMTSMPSPVDAFVPTSVFTPVTAPVVPELNYKPEFYGAPIPYGEPTNGVKGETSDEKDKVPAYNSVETSLDLTAKLLEDEKVSSEKDESLNPFLNMISDTLQEEIVVSYPQVIQSIDENADIDSKQREVKVVKKQVTNENKVEEHNGDENGDSNDDAALTIKLPTKKSGAKTETKVEVEKKVLPDGSIEEVKTTTTKTTIDGRTEIKTKTETTITPKQEESEEEVEEEEEAEKTIEENTVEQQELVEEEPETVTVTETISAPKENGNIIKTEERSETTIAKKVVVVQDVPQPEQSEIIESEEVEEKEEEEGEEDTAEPVTIVLKKPVTPQPEIEDKPVKQEVEEEEEEIEEEVEKEPETVKEETVKDEVKQETEVEDEEGEESQEAEEVELKEEVKEISTKDDGNHQEEEEESEVAENQNQVVEEDTQETVAKVEKKPDVKEVEELQTQESIEEEVKEEVATETSVEASKEAVNEEEHIIPIQVQTAEELKSEEKENDDEKPTEFTIPIREPSVPLEKVEDIEIKPIGISPIITKTHTEDTEIITSTLDPSGGLSKQTEYNKIENIVTVNRTTKILDHSYENVTQQGIPTVKTYFPPPSVDRIAQSSVPSRPYQPVYPPEPTTERRHSLLLDRLSVERQLPTDVYQYNNQSYEQTQYQVEPQSEVLTVSNVKPSTITNQQWYQQTKQTQNVLYNNATSTPAPVGAPWAQPKSPQPQFQSPTPQPHYQAQYQPPPQPQFQRGTTPQPQFQRGTTPQPQFQKATTPQPQYQPSYSEPIRDRTPTNSYSSYPSTPTWVTSAVDSTSTPYASSNTDTTQTYQKNTLSSSTNQYFSGYVPPPWEQDSSYTSVNNTSEKYYQELPSTNPFSPGSTQSWKPTPPPAKFTKNAPIAYVPPAPNQSFVKPVSNIEPPRQPGRKTYYSEYERRYITVPESTYIPTETKYQPQPDPSPHYYYDNNEPTETIEPQWRKELREFTEKTSQTITTEQTNVQPPWEADSKYGKTQSVAYTPTPTWSQTLKPKSYRERSFESECVSQEWPRTNSLGRGRPLSTMSVDAAIPERVRGVSVDRYNLNSYHSPAEHPPVQSHTLTTPAPHAGYHNPNVPAYHSRASAEPREHPTNYQQRVYRESRASPLQSRSFKYLQWITGTEN